jgi:hypothetical protein
MNFKHETFFPKKIREAFESQGYTGNKTMSEIKIICKVFNPVGSATFWLYEHQEEDIYMAFCLLNDHREAEIGSISMEEIMEVKLPMGLHFELDRYFTPGEITLETIFNEIKSR